MVTGIIAPGKVYIYIYIYRKRERERERERERWVQVTHFLNHRSI